MVTLVCSSHRYLSVLVAFVSLNLSICYVTLRCIAFVIDHFPIAAVLVLAKKKCIHSILLCISAKSFFSRIFSPACLGEGGRVVCFA